MRSSGECRKGTGLCNRRCKREPRWALAFPNAPTCIVESSSPSSSPASLLYYVPRWCCSLFKRAYSLALTEGAGERSIMDNVGSAWLGRFRIRPDLIGIKGVTNVRASARGNPRPAERGIPGSVNVYHFLAESSSLVDARTCGRLVNAVSSSRALP